MIKSKKILIIVLVVVVISFVLAGAYYFGSRSQVGGKILEILPSSGLFSQTEDDIDLSSQEASGAQAGREIILMFNMLQSVEIDSDFFKDQVFQSLKLVFYRTDIFYI